jgi:hypothetical protein
MNPELIQKLEKSISNLKDKSSRIYFMVQDTKGNAKGSVSYIYKMALTLKRAGYNSIILHEKPDYMGVTSWLGEEYMTELPHKSIEGQNLDVAPDDFIIVPELYGFVMPQLNNLPCSKIVLCQSYDYMFETLQPGQTWAQFGFNKCITTSELQKEYISNVMKNVTFDIVEPLISEVFKKQILPPKPIIAVHTRDQRETLNLIKTFYIKFPQYRWVTFRDMRGLSESEFAKGFNDVFLSVWIDDISGFGTFPIESMKSGVPVIGKIPNLFPQWMNEDNGIWIQNQNQIVDFVADFIQNWLEDNINTTIYEGIEKTANEYSSKEKYENKVVRLFDSYFYTRMISFMEQLNKLETPVTEDGK